MKPNIKRFVDPHGTVIFRIGCSLDCDTCIGVGVQSIAALKQEWPQVLRALEMEHVAAAIRDVINERPHDRHPHSVH